MQEQSFENIIKTRCIQIVDDDNPPCVDYHKVIEREEQEQLNGEYLVDHIIKESYPPVSKWQY